MEMRNVETWYCRGDGPVARVSSCNPGLRRGAPRRRRGRCDARRQRRVPRCSSKHRRRGFERRWRFLLPPALGVLRSGVREVYGRRWRVASLPIKAKKEPKQMMRSEPVQSQNATMPEVKSLKLSSWDVVYALNMAIACFITYWIMTHSLSRFVDGPSDFLGGMWAVVATVFVFRETRLRSLSAGIAGLIATCVSS